MKEAGIIKHYTKYRLFVVEAKEKLPLSTKLLDSKGNIVGEIVDIIGPINKPYLIVKPYIENPEKYVGAHLYYLKIRRRGR